MAHMLLIIIILYEGHRILHFAPLQNRYRKQKVPGQKGVLLQLHPALPDWNFQPAESKIFHFQTGNKSSICDAKFESHEREG